MHAWNRQYQSQTGSAKETDKSKLSKEIPTPLSASNVLK